METKHLSSGAPVQGASLPRRQVVCVCLVELLEAIIITMPYTIAVYMVRSWVVESGQDDAQTEERVSRLTGVLAGLWCAAQFMTSIFWGYLSDRWGRKGVVLLGTLALAVSITVFGLSGGFLVACLARFVGGLFDGILGALKTMVGEFCDASHQGEAMGYLSFAWGLGTIVGPAIGGLLANPCDNFGVNFPLCSPTGLFQTRPFALPCLVAGVICLLVFMLCLFYMEETLPAHRGWTTGYAHLATSEAAELTQHGSDEIVYSLGSAQTPRGEVPANVETRADGHPAVTPRNNVPQDDQQQTVELVLVNDAHAATAEMITVEIEQQTALSNIQVTNSSTLRAAEDIRSTHADATSIKLTIAQSTDMTSGDEQPKSSRHPSEMSQEAAHQEDHTAAVVWWRDHQVQLTVGGYGLIALLYTLVDEVTPIFASAPRPEGGLGLSTSSLSGPLSFGGFVLMLFALLAYPRLQRRYGAVQLGRIGLLATVPCVLAIPAASLFGGGRAQYVLGQVTLYAALGAKGIAETCIFTSSFLLINAAAPAGQMGAVNGASQMVAALVRGFAPVAGGLLWAAALHTHLPGHQFVAFAVAAVGCLLTQMLYAQVRQPVS